jgi:hypothetical protein
MQFSGKLQSYGPGSNLEDFPCVVQKGLGTQNILWTLREAGNTIEHAKYDHDEWLRIVIVSFRFLRLKKNFPHLLVFLLSPVIFEGRL